MSSDQASGQASDPRLLFTGPSPFGGHRYALFELCPRRYGLTHEVYPMPVRDAAGTLISAPHVDADPEAEESGGQWELIRGTMIHTGLAHHYARLRARQKGDEATLNLLYEPADAMEALCAQEVARNPFDRDLWHDALSIGTTVLKGYAAKYAFEKIRVEAVEEVFVMEFGDSLAPYTFRLDLGVRDSAGKVWMMDHKTTTRIRDYHNFTYGVSIQFQAYAIAGQSIYADSYGGVSLNMIECGDKGSVHFVRPDLPAIPGFLAGFAARIEALYLQMQDLVVRGVPPSLWPKKPGYSSCRAFGKVCPYYERCRLSP
jgi:hypothetical protein